MAGRAVKNLVVLAALLVGLAGSAAAQLAPRVPLFGYVDRTGKVVEPATYDKASQLFLGDWVGVSRKGKAGYLNLRTRASTGLVFEEVADNYERPLFADGPEPARIGGKWGFVDESGKFVIPPRFDSAAGFEADGLAVVAISEPGGSGHGFIDKSGRFVVPPKYALLRPYKGGLAAFRGRTGSGVGAIDREGREVIPPRFVSLGDFGDNGLAPANVGGYARTEDVRLGYVDRAGRFVTPQDFVLAGTFVPFAIEGGMSTPDGHALVRLENGQSAYLDSAARIVARFPEDVFVLEISANGLVRIQDKSGKYGFADRKGAIVIPPRFRQAWGFGSNDLAPAEENGKYGYIRADGSWAIEPRFQMARSFDEFGHAQVEENGAHFLVDRSGKRVATLTNGESFYWQKKSGYASFRVTPPREELPPERFGAWTLERTIYAEADAAWEGPTPTSEIRLTSVSGDGALRWTVSTEGWRLLVSTSRVDKVFNSTAGQHLPDLPGSPDVLIRALKTHLRQSRQFTLPTFREPADPSQKRERRRQAALIEQRYGAELARSASDLERAMQAMRVRIKEHYGKLSNAEPCLPPDCIH